MICLLIKRLRLADPLRYKFPFILSAILLMADLVSIPPLRFIVLIAASFVLMFGFAGFGYLTNDWADIEKDALVNKPNALQGTTTAQRAGLLVLFVFMIWPPWLVLPFTYVSALFIIGEILLFVSYAFPPLRLKEREWLGIVADAGYAHLVPALFAAYTFSLAGSVRFMQLPTLLGLLAVWQGIVGIRNILLHQLQDAENDLHSGTHTFLTGRGRINSAERFIRICLIPLEAVALMLLFVFTLYHQQPLVSLSFLIFIAWQLFYKKLSVDFMDYRNFLYTYADPYYNRWLPVSLLLTYLLHAAGVCFNVN